jgi:RND family efflux transporter MFP subunit
MHKRSIYLFLLMTLVAGHSACSGGNENKNVNNVPPVAVTLSTVSAGVQPAILASGQVEAVQTADISTRMMGRITNIYVKVGDRVEKGQLLASVWDEDVKSKRAQADAMIAEAEGSYSSAKRDYDRFNSLYKQQSATAKELDNATLQYNSAKARVTAAKQMRSEVNAILSYSRLTAPFPGMVIGKSGEVGNIANPGVPILTIQQIGVFQVSASVAESEISRISLGNVANVQIKSTGKSFEGKIIQINPSAQFTGGRYIVKISIPGTAKADIYAGMYAGISIPITNSRQIKEHAVLVPLSAIINREQLTGIFTVGINNTALLRWIRLGKTYGDKVEVTSGLSVGEKFICFSDNRLYNGVPVLVKTGPVASTATINTQ